MVKSVSIEEDSLPPLSAGRRRKADDEDLNGSSSKKARTRVSFSCGECHRRKQKCDRQVPCSHCVARKVPELCKAYTPGKAEQDVNARLSRLEHIIELALPHLAGPSSHDAQHRFTHRFASPSPDDDTRSQADEQDTNGGLLQSGKWYGNSASGSIAPSTVLEQLQNAVLPSSSNRSRAASERPHGGDKDGQSNSPVSDPAAHVLEPSAADRLKALVQECGVSPHKIPELLQELPPQRHSAVLIDFYFKYINWTRYPISEQEFRSSFTEISTHGAEGISATNPNDIRFLPLLFVVLAIAARLAPVDIAGDARTRRVTSLRYYWSSRRSLLIAAAIQPDSIEMVLTRLLSARFLTFDRRITECWSQLGAAVRTAQALGIHRDGVTMGLSASQTEYRRRIWSYLYHADRSYALVLGRPNSIQDDYTSTKVPINIDDEVSSVTSATLPPPLPITMPTGMTFVILRHQIAIIIGRIVHHFQKVTPSHYSEVIALDDDLLRFAKSLPPHFALEPDTSLDDTMSYIPAHRFLLITEILFVRMSLHRPYILRRLNTDRYARSRAACFESALKDFQVRQSFRGTLTQEIRDSMNNAYRLFQTALVSGIYLVLEPNGADAESMHLILDSFLKEHEGLREIDETTRRELVTIEFLKKKANDRRSEGQQSNGDEADSATSGAESPAQLLLGLQQSSSTSNPSPPFIPGAASHFPSIFSLDGSIPMPDIVNAVSGPPSLSASPTFQRLQSGVGDFVPSPTTTGSPNGDGEPDSTAQSLLDHWYNTISTAPLDSATSLTNTTTWPAISNSEMSGWTGRNTPLMGTDANFLNQIEGSEWSYWETLVNQIQQPT